MGSEAHGRWGPELSLLLVFGVVAVLFAATLAGTTAAHPPNSTDHNVSNESFHGLWSNDEDKVGSDATIPDGSDR